MFYRTKTVKQKYFIIKKIIENLLETASAESFFKTLAEIQNANDIKKFMRDICTISELKNMIERLDVAKRVQKKQPYRKITGETGVSSATITRVAHWLKYGEGGYQIALALDRH